MESGVAGNQLSMRVTQKRQDYGQTQFHLHRSPVLATIVGEMVVCSIGLNLKKAPKEFSILDIKLDKKQIIQNLILKIKSKKWFLKIIR